jgi:hypothetical protein
MHFLSGGILPIRPDLWLDIVLAGWSLDEINKNTSFLITALVQTPEQSPIYKSF